MTKQFIAVQEPVTCALSSQVDILLGTQNGLWSLDTERHLLKKLHQTAYVYDIIQVKQAYWLGTEDGWLLLKENSLSSAPLREAVQGIYHVNSLGTFFLSNQSVYKLDTKSKALDKILACDGGFIAIDAQGIAAMIEGKLQFRFHHKVSPDPLQDNSEKPENILNFTSVDERLIVGTQALAQWQYYNGKWKRLQQLVELDAISGKYESEAGILIGFNNINGLAILRDESIEPVDSPLAYVRDLAKIGDGVYALASSKQGLHHHIQLWEKAASWKAISSLPVDSGVVFGLMGIDKVLILCRKGIWNAETGEWIQSFTEDFLIWAIEGDKALLSDGYQIFHVSPISVQKLEFNQGRITALALADDSFYIGTNNGLFRASTFNGSWTHWLPYTSGLAHASIVNLGIWMNHLLVQTSYGTQLLLDAGNSKNI